MRYTLLAGPFGSSGIADRVSDSLSVYPLRLLPKRNVGDGLEQGRPLLRGDSVDRGSAVVRQLLSNMQE